MHEIIESLKHLGLTDKESRVYIALLRFTQATVGEIADEAQIKRPTVYVVLDELRKKGLVLKIPHAKKALFQAKTPDELYEQTVSNTNKLSKILPKLRSLNPSSKPIKTLYFEGVNGIKESLYYRIGDLKDSTTYGFWAKNDGGISQPVIDLFNKWSTDISKTNILVSGVTPEHSSTREYVENYKEFYKDLTIAPIEDYNSDISIEVTKEFIRIIDGHEMKAIIIENPRIMHALKQIFDLAKRNYVQK
jgi:sugar-specific transcriptional regulator TrmB